MMALVWVVIDCDDDSVVNSGGRRHHIPAGTDLETSNMFRRLFRLLHHIHPPLRPDTTTSSAAGCWSQQHCTNSIIPLQVIHTPPRS